jgi:EAL domain-containing protein (putative c-di-GMP-specific phosphodiesterase class I)
MRDNVVAHIEMEKDFRQAIERKEWVLHYQPILSLKNGQIIGFEALIRWNHPRKGMIWPNDFIPFAEETGLIIPMGEWVLQEACQQMNIWHRRFPTDPPLTISVNLSSKQFTQAELFDQIQNAITETNFDPHYLRLEITESVIMENAEQAISTLNRLQRMGVQVHIDDFGTGYSSLVYLHMLPINAIKIDHSFISGNGIQNHHGLEIAQSIVRLAHDLKMETIAEGVETQAQFDKLTDLECEYAQGFHISLCMDKKIAEKLLEEKFVPAKTIPEVN